MSTIEKKTMDHKCGPGGTGCRCCNRYFGSEKPKLFRMIRRSFKQLLKNDIKKERD